MEREGTSWCEGSLENVGNWVPEEMESGHHHLPIALLTNLQFSQTHGSLVMTQLILILYCPN